MKTLIASILGLTALSSVALAGEPTRLTQAQMDQVTAGQPTANASITLSATASGPNSSDVTGSADANSAVVGGLSPSATSDLTASLSSSSS